MSGKSALDTEQRRVSGLATATIAASSQATLDKKWGNFFILSCPFARHPLATSSTQATAQRTEGGMHLGCRMGIL